MGEAKALLPLGGETFAARLVRTFRAAGAGPVLVVVAPDTAEAVAASVGTAARVIVNPQPSRGQLSSLQTGLSALPADVAGVLVTPVDLPLVGAATVSALMRAWRASGAAVVRPSSAKRHGHPVLVGPPVIRALLAAGADRTARTVMQAFAADTVDVPVDDEGAFTDIDTREEYLRVLDASKVEEVEGRGRSGSSE